ncbi:MAG: antitoxin family protein [Deltaproteobacteria bacterium]|nr:antitoxin family protein [Deltaproteobacteria bacterium]MBI5874288.1 antitoxin family protein [Deltaproteobacteria bacterium]
MLKTVEAVYEKGVLKPLKKLRIGEHEKVELTIVRKTEIDAMSKKALSIIGIGKSNFKDTAARHDEYLYGKKLRTLIKP